VHSRVDPVMSDDAPHMQLLSTLQLGPDDPLQRSEKQEFGILAILEVLMRLKPAHLSLNRNF
jgi:hypothetical protein